MTSNDRFGVSNSSIQATEMRAQSGRSHKAPCRLLQGTRHVVAVPSAEPPNDVTGLISSLCLEVGRIMEDESPELALRLPAGSEAIGSRLDRARSAGEDIAKLMAAAEVLRRRYIEG